MKMNLACLNNHHFKQPPQYMEQNAQLPAQHTANRPYARVLEAIQVPASL
jgi:hypothetical protein